MRNNSYIIENISQNIIECAIEESKNRPKVSTSNTIVNGVIQDEIFYKKLNTERIKKMYKGDYIKLWEENYKTLRDIIPLNNIYAIIQMEDEEIYEFSEKIPEEKFLSNGNTQKWKDIENLYIKILSYINNIIEYQKETKKIIGIETAIWNFSIDGKLFDLDPPRLILDGQDSSFTRENDIDHYKRTIYRNFTEIGMKTNLLATTIIGLQDGNFKIPDLPQNWIEILSNYLIQSILEQSKKDRIGKILKGEEAFKPSFSKHPIDIIMKKINTKEQEER